MKAKSTFEFSLLSHRFHWKKGSDREKKKPNLITDSQFGYTLSMDTSCKGKS